MKKFSWAPIVLLAVSVVCLCCFCLVVSGIIYHTLAQTSPAKNTVLVTATEIPPSPVPSATPSATQVEVMTPLPLPTPTKTSVLALGPTQEFQAKPQEKALVPLVPTDTLHILQNVVVPANNLYDLALRLEGKVDVSPTLPPPAMPYQTGDHMTFWASNVDTDENFQVEAVMQYATDHVYFWVEVGVDFDPGELQDLVETFERKIYPTDREFFGSEWTPGVDGDPHLYILYAHGLGSSVAGYFSSADEYSPQVHEYSNAHEMFFLNADSVQLNSKFTYGVLAHEFQHMIHWYRDRNEDAWLNEGFSELAAFLNGYYTDGFDRIYARDPDLQLNSWPEGPNGTAANYGASFLYLLYFLDRFGEQATKDLVANPKNGLVSVDDVLGQIGVVDNLTGRPIQADDVFLDWVITSFIEDGRVGDGRYVYHNYPGAPRTGVTDTFRTCPVGETGRDVHQYGVDYLRFTCRGDYTLHFAGANSVKVVPTEPHSGEYAFWSNKGDESDMTLTQTFDFSQATGPLTLTYWTWFDLEKDYDYLYLTASTDGEKWEVLLTPSGTAEDPSGNSYGWGYTGISGGGFLPRWIQETVDLSQFAGEKVQLRFEYVTDTVFNGEGFLLDDVAIPEIGYFADFEHGDGGWEASGWVRIQNELPQTFRLALISMGNTTSVEYIPLSKDQTADIPLRMSNDVQRIILVVTGTTQFTNQKALYQIKVSP